ncbi:MAG: Ig-like domain-containing protein [Promethearchaeota archaeon]
MKPPRKTDRAGKKAGAYSLLWLFKKRLFFESRKYTSGIILTGGVTSLFVALLIVGSSFISAYYRATGQNGPRIFDIYYGSSRIDLNDDKPSSVNVTCAVTDYFQVTDIKLYYTCDFWYTKQIIDGKYQFSNLTGNYYEFSINISSIDKPTTILFFIWAKNTGGFFGFNDNGGLNYLIRIDYPEPTSESNGTGNTDLFQYIMIDEDNKTLTRNPRPSIKFQVNETSDAWIVVNGKEYDKKVNSLFFLFVIEDDLLVGNNTIEIFVKQNQTTYNKTLILKRTILPPQVISVYPADNQTIINTLNGISINFDENVTGIVTLTGPINQSWTISQACSTLSLSLDFNSAFGNYSIDIDVVDNYNLSGHYQLGFQFKKSQYPFIDILSLVNDSNVVEFNLTIMVQLSEKCNVSIEHLNISNSTLNYYNVSSINIDNFNLVTGDNIINVSATNEDNYTNSTLIHIVQNPYIIDDLDYDFYVLPNTNLTINIECRTHLEVNGSIFYRFDYNGSYYQREFILLENASKPNRYLSVNISAPDNVHHIDFYIELWFGAECKILNQDGFNYHVTVEYLYHDNTAPIFQDVKYPNNPNSNAICSIKVYLFDVTGIQNVSLYYSRNYSSNDLHEREMYYIGNDTNKNGLWIGFIPAHVNNTVINFTVITRDLFNNTAMYSADYIVHDEAVAPIPGVFSREYQSNVSGAIITLITIMFLIIIVFVLIYIMINDQNIKRELFRERGRIFIMRRVCNLTLKGVKKYYYIEQLVQELIGQAIGVTIGFLAMAPLFVYVLKITLVAWTLGFHELYYLSYNTLESWVFLLLFLFICCSLLLKLLQVDKYFERLVD